MDASTSTCSNVLPSNSASCCRILAACSNNRSASSLLDSKRFVGGFCLIVLDFDVCIYEKME